ncbi:MAG: hypothetical protein ABF649_09490 [Bacillus sp. (in: firmicutes)]
MKFKLILITSLLLLPSSIALADEGNANKTNSSNDMEMFMNEGSSHEGHTMNSEEQGNTTNETGSTAHNESGAGKEGGHNHSEQDIKETPPNYKVLSVFGAINLLFLVIGFWNKRIRKRGKIDVTTGQKA